ncbi:glycosyltransferase, CAZy family GT4 [Planoprotostelium fungivorum]|uniref:Glycosyltransferase, CAZy family GT4 n=1 Tax=Planoprotostelium fungivorum TaxID=1890364 RepID=A0A2P6NJA5_9EUKA|nr:glycosyltransferase, CAZy family GT4 [Planoprotostelium fungivorum]
MRRTITIALFLLLGISFVLGGGHLRRREPLQHEALVAAALDDLKENEGKVDNSQHSKDQVSSPNDSHIPPSPTSNANGDLSDHQSEVVLPDNTTTGQIYKRELETIEGSLTAVVVVEDVGADGGVLLQNCLTHLVSVHQKDRPKHKLQILVVPIVSGTAMSDYHYFHDVYAPIVQTFHKNDVDASVVEPLSVTEMTEPNYAKEVGMAYTAHSYGQYLFFLSHRTQINSGYFKTLVPQLNEEVGVISGLVLQPDNTIFWAGIDFHLSSMPSRGGQYDSNWSSDTNFAVPSFRHQGRVKYDRRVAKRSEVHSTSAVSFLVSSEVLEKANGFDYGFNDPTYVVMDLCLHIKASKLGKTVYEPSATSYYLGPETDPAEDHLEPEAVALNMAHGAKIVETLRGAYLLSNFTLKWNMECGKGQVLGFTTEAIGFLSALEGKIPLKIQVNSLQQCIDDLTSLGIPKCTTSMMRRLYNAHAEGPEILVLHRDPGRYSHFLDISGTISYVIGRLPENWANAIYRHADVVWVPSQFNVKTFTEAGVNASMLVAVPEAVDTHTYDASHYEEGKLEKFQLPKRKNFNFLSIMKWERRKGWDVLLRGYYNAFTAQDDVSLYIRANMAPENWDEYREFSSQCSQEQIRAGRNGSLPQVIILPNQLPFNKMPSLYNAADSVVLATHGEGWGLPVIEGLTMGLPVITTNWSGVTEFAKEEDTYLLPVDELTDATVEGHKWAALNETALSEQMRRIYNSPDEAKRRGRAAQKRISAVYNEEAIAARVIEQLAPIVNNITELKAARQARLATWQQTTTGYGGYQRGGYGQYNGQYASSVAGTPTPVLPNGRVRIKSATNFRSRDANSGVCLEAIGGCRVKLHPAYQPPIAGYWVYSLSASSTYRKKHSEHASLLFSLTTTTNTRMAKRKSPLRETADEERDAAQALKMLMQGSWEDGDSISSHANTHQKEERLTDDENTRPSKSSRQMTREEKREELRQRLMVRTGRTTPQRTREDPWRKE